MQRPPRIRFRSGVSLVECSERVLIDSALGRTTVEGVTTGLLEVTRILASEGATENDLADLVLSFGGAPNLAPLYYYLGKWSDLGLLQYQLIHNDRLLAALLPVKPGFRFEPLKTARSDRFQLSRFAYWHRQGSALVVESPLSSAQLLLFDEITVQLLAELIQPREYSELCSRDRALGNDVTAALLAFFVNARAIGALNEDASLPEDADLPLRQWEFHDLLFHSCSRGGRFDESATGAFRFLGEIAPLPSVKPTMAGERTALTKPDLERLKSGDLPFTRILENRASIRKYGERPITIEQLGEFLFRVARVRHIIEPVPESAYTIRQAIALIPRAAGHTISSCTW